MGWWSSRVGSLALARDAYQTDRKPFPVGKRNLASRRLRNHLPNLTISVMTNISALLKSDIVRGADLARAAAAGDRAALAVARDREAGMAMVEVASAHGDFPLRVTGKSHRRYLRDKYEDLVVYLA